MALESHLVELSEKHRKLELAIEKELQHPGSSDLRISELKREKLKIKDEIEKLKKTVH